MTKSLHVYAAGLDPFVFFVGEVEVHVHLGVPPATPPPPDDKPAAPQPTPLILTPLESPYEALQVHSADDMAHVLQEASGSVGGPISVALGQSESGPELAAQVGAILIGLQQFSGETDVDIYISDHGWD